MVSDFLHEIFPNWQLISVLKCIITLLCSATLMKDDAWVNFTLYFSCYECNCASFHVIKSCCISFSVFHWVVFIFLLIHWRAFYIMKIDHCLRYELQILFLLTFGEILFHVRYLFYDFWVLCHIKISLPLCHS